MKKVTNMDKPRYVDPNSGAAPQPGGAAGFLGSERGHAVMAESEEDSSKEQIVSPDGLSVYPNEPQAPSYETHEVDVSNELTEAERVEAKVEEVGGSLDGSFVNPDAAPVEDEPADEPVEEPAEDEDEVVDEDVADAYDPSEHTVDEVLIHLEKNPDQRDAVVAAERSGKARKGITGDE